MNKKVLNKWNTEGNLAVIYRVDNVLLFYTSDTDPKFKPNQEVSLEEAQSTNPYKALPYHIDNVPNDAYLELTFSWKVD